MWLNFLKVLLLMVGVALVAGGSVTGLCGASARQGDVVLLALVPIALGMLVFVVVARTYKPKAEPAPASAESGEEPPTGEPRP